MRLVETLESAFNKYFTTAIVSVLFFSVGYLLHDLAILFIKFVIPNLDEKYMIKFMAAILVISIVLFILVLYLYLKVKSLTKFKPHKRGYMVDKNGYAYCPSHTPYRLLSFTDQYEKPGLLCRECKNNWLLNEDEPFYKNHL